MAGAALDAVREAISKFLGDPHGERDRDFTEGGGSAMPVLPHFWAVAGDSSTLIGYRLRARSRSAVVVMLSSLVRLMYYSYSNNVAVEVRMKEASVFSICPPRGLSAAGRSTGCATGN